MLVGFVFFKLIIVIEGRGQRGGQGCHRPHAGYAPARVRGLHGLWTKFEAEIIFFHYNTLKINNISYVNIRCIFVRLEFCSSCGTLTLQVMGFSLYDCLLILGVKMVVIFNYFRIH